MGYLHCCGALRKCKTYKIKLSDNLIFCELDFLEKCPSCEHTVLKLTKVKNNGESSTYILKNKKAKAFFEKIKPEIICESVEVNNIFTTPKSKLYLNYNEYGKKKKCFSNLSTMKLGLFENTNNFY